MTKLKSKKMSKSTFAVIIMAIAMVAMIAFGATYAWFTSGAAFNMTDNAQTNMGKIVLTEGSHKVSASSLTVDVLPTEDLFKENENNFDVVDGSNRASYIFFNITATVEKYTPGAGVDGTDYAAPVALEELAFTGMTVTYVDADEQTQTISHGSITGEDGWFYILTEEDVTEGETFTVSGFQAHFEDTVGDEYQLARITVVIECASIQAAGFAGDADAAFAVCFAEEA